MAGRPREFDVDVALAAIQRTFWTHGYDGTAMSDLVAATGLASARLYAAFGSKQDAFRAAVNHYRQHEGSFADRAFAGEPDVHRAFERMYLDAIDCYTRPAPRGCLVVSAALACTPASDDVRDWLAGLRRARRESIVTRVRHGVADGQLPAGTDDRDLGDYLATVLDGISVAARDGVSRRRLRATATRAVAALPQP